MPEAPAGAAESEATEQEMSRHIEMMQALMPGMKARMETIKSTTDLQEQERRGLLKAHLADMDKGMEMMKSMPMCVMMSGKGMVGQGQGMMMGSDMMKCRQMMHYKMEMMHMMLEGLLESAKMKE